MSRVKGGKTTLKSRRNTLAQTKGYSNARKRKKRQAYEAIVHAGSHAFAHRRDKKNDFRRLWNVRINAAVRGFGTTYSKFINLLKQKEVALDRKILATIAKDNPESFERIMKKIS